LIGSANIDEREIKTLLTSEACIPVVRDVDLDPVEALQKSRLGSSVLE